MSSRESDELLKMSSIESEETVKIMRPSDFRALCGCPLEHECKVNTQEFADRVKKSLYCCWGLTCVQRAFEGCMNQLEWHDPKSEWYCRTTCDPTASKNMKFLRKDLQRELMSFFSSDNEKSLDPPVKITASHAYCMYNRVPLMYTVEGDQFKDQCACPMKLYCLVTDENKARTVKSSLHVCQIRVENNQFCDGKAYGPCLGRQMKSPSDKFWCRKHNEYSLRRNFYLFKEQIQQAIVDPNLILEIDLDEEDRVLSEAMNISINSDGIDNEINKKCIDDDGEDNLSEISQISKTKNKTQSSTSDPSAKSNTDEWTKCNECKALLFSKYLNKEGNCGDCSKLIKKNEMEALLAGSSSDEEQQKPTTKFKKKTVDMTKKKESLDNQNTDVKSNNTSNLSDSFFEKDPKGKLLFDTTSELKVQSSKDHSITDKTDENNSSFDENNIIEPLKAIVFVDFVDVSTQTTFSSLSTIEKSENIETIEKSENIETSENSDFDQNYSPMDSPFQDKSGGAQVGRMRRDFGLLFNERNFTKDFVELIDKINNSNCNHKFAAGVKYYDDSLNNNDFDGLSEKIKTSGTLLFPMRVWEGIKGQSICQIIVGLQLSSNIQSNFAMYPIICKSNSFGIWNKTNDLTISRTILLNFLKRQTVSNVDNDFKVSELKDISTLLKAHFESIHGNFVNDTKLQDKVLHLSEENVSLKNTQKDFQRTIQLKDKEILQLTNSVSQMQEELATTKYAKENSNASSSAVKQLQKQRTEIEKLIVEIDKLKNDVSNEKSKVNEHKRQTAEKATELATITKDLAERKKVMEKSDTQIKSLETTVQKLKDQLAEQNDSVEVGAHDKNNLFRGKSKRGNSATNPNKHIPEDSQQDDSYNQNDFHASLERTIGNQFSRMFGQQQVSGGFQFLPPPHIVHQYPPQVQVQFQPPVQQQQFQPPAVQPQQQFQPPAVQPQQQQFQPPAVQPQQQQFQLPVLQQQQQFQPPVQQQQFQLPVQQQFQPPVQQQQQQFQPPVQQQQQQFQPPVQPQQQQQQFQPSVQQQQQQQFQPPAVQPQQQQQQFQPPVQLQQQQFQPPVQLQQQQFQPPVQQQQQHFQPPVQQQQQQQPFQPPVQQQQQQAFQPQAQQQNDQSYNY